MTNGEIKEYIKKQKSFNLPEDKIRSNLESVGWIKDDIDQAFSEIEKENTIASISASSEMERAVPTIEDSGYTKDPYREPVGSGAPQAQTFIKEEKPQVAPGITRDWVSPSSQKTPESRQGQKFAPKYTAVPMEETDGVRPVIPELKKMDTNYVGTSFVPKKEVSTQTLSVPQPPTSVSGPISAFKVMPTDVSNISAGNLTNEDFNKLRQAIEPKKKSGLLGKLITVILLIIIITGGVLFADIAGYIELPIKIPFIDSLKQNTNNTVEDKQDIFVPKIDISDTQEVIDDAEESIEDDLGLDVDQNTGEDASSVEMPVNLEVKQEINLKDDEDITPSQGQNIQ